MGKNRIAILKLIFMIMVVFIHSTELPKFDYELVVPKWLEAMKTFVRMGICGVAVQGFFLIAGFLLFSKEFTWKRNMKKKLRTIGIPYLFFNTFWLLFFVVMQSNSITASYFLDEAYQIEGWQDILRAYIISPIYYPFWFLKDLFILNVFAVVIREAVKRVPILYGIFMLLLPFLKWDIHIGKYSLLFFSIGCYLAIYRFKATILDEINWCFIIGVNITLVILYLKTYSPIIMCIYYIAETILLYKFTGIIWKSKYKERITNLSEYTFVIYVFHEYYEAMLKKVAMMLLPQIAIVQLAEYYSIPIIIIISCVSGGKLLQKYFPKVFSVVTGNRILNGKLEGF